MGMISSDPGAFGDDQMGKIETVSSHMSARIGRSFQQPEAQLLNDAIKIFSGLRDGLSDTSYSITGAPLENFHSSVKMIDGLSRLAEGFENKLTTLREELEISPKVVRSGEIAALAEEMQLVLLKIDTSFPDLDLPQRQKFIECANTLGKYAKAPVVEQKNAA